MMGKSHRIPHEDPLVPLVYTKAKRGISLKVLSMLQTTENLRECDMSILVVVDLYSRAADRRQQVYAGLTAALEATKPPRQQPKRRQQQQQQPAAGANGTPQQQPPPAVPGAGQPPGKPAPQQREHREKVDDSFFLPNPTRMSREARAAKRDDRLVSCHNCDDHSGYPRHRPTKCPFRRFDGYQWDAPHEPVAKL